MPLVQRENVRLASELQRVTEERDEAAERERQYREQHGREMREVSSSYQHMHFLFQQAKATIAQQQHTIDQLKQQLSYKHIHTLHHHTTPSTTTTTSSSHSSSAAPPPANTPSTHPTFYLNTTLAPATAQPEPSQPPPQPVQSSSELSELTSQLTTVTSRLEQLTSENDWLQSTQSSLVARLQLTQTELKRLKQNQQQQPGGGWSQYVDVLKLKEREVEYNKLKRDVDWLNQQLQSSQQLITAYESKSSSKTTHSATAKQHKDNNGSEIEHWRVRYNQAESDKTILKTKLESIEIELFTTEENRLQTIEQHNTEINTLQTKITQLNENLLEKDNILRNLHTDIKAMQSAWEDKERSMSNQWMAQHSVNELRDKVQYLTALKRDNETERETLKRRIEEITSELILQNGKHEQEVVELRKESLKREEERRVMSEADEERRTKTHRTQVENVRLQGEIDVLQKRIENYTTQLNTFKNKLIDSSNRTFVHSEDEQKLRNQLDSVSTELTLLKSELAAIRNERIKLIEETNSLSMLIHSHEDTIRELNDNNTTLTTQLKQRDRVDLLKKEELEAKSDWTREEAERLIKRQQSEVERVRSEMSSCYEKLSQIRNEKNEMYEMLKICDMQLVKIQLEFKRMEEDKIEREREVNNEKQLRVKQDEHLQQLKQERQQSEDTITNLTRERDEYAVKEREANHTIQLVRMEVTEKDEQIKRVIEEKDRKLVELSLCMRREEESTAKYWSKERECRELTSQLSQITWEKERCEKEVIDCRNERDRSLRRVEEVETVVRHMDVMSFARDEEMKSLLNELDNYRSELMRRVQEIANLKETIETNKDTEDSHKRKEREFEATVKELEREVERRKDELIVATKQYESLNQTDNVYRQLINQLQSDIQDTNRRQPNQRSQYNKPKQSID